jgi:hypothetical protein
MHWWPLVYIPMTAFELSHECLRIVPTYGTSGVTFFFYYIILLPVEELLRSLVLHKSRIVILLRNLGALRG